MMSGTITIVGLGYGDEQGLPLGTLHLLEQSEHLFLRTEKHPVVPWLSSRGISFTTFDSVYEAHEDFELVYKDIAGKLLGKASSCAIVYAVPGHPMVAERVVQLLLQDATKRGVTLNIAGGGSFLDIAFSRLQIDPIEGFLFLDGNDFDETLIQPSLHLLIGQVYSRMVASNVKLTLMEMYDDDHPIRIARALGISGEERIIEIPLYQLDRNAYFNDLTSVYVPPVKG